MQTPRDDTLRAWSALLVAHRRLTDELDAELRAGMDMTLDEYDLLHQVERAGAPLKMSELASRVLISRPTMSRVCDRLVERGWIERHGDPVDRRVVRVGLTRRGRAAWRRAAALHFDGVARRFEAPLSRSQIDAVADALGVLAAPPPDAS